MTNKNMKSVGFNVTEEEFVKIDKASKVMGLRPSAFVKMCTYKLMNKA